MKARLKAAPSQAASQQGTASDRVFQTALLGCMLWTAGSLALGLGGLWLQARGDFGWSQPGKELILLAVVCAAASYLQRLLRWYALACRLAPGLDLKSGLVFGSIGFALTVTPGRAGEVLKLYLLQRHRGVPLAASAPILLVEKAAEGLGFLAVAALGGALLGLALIEGGSGDSGVPAAPPDPTPVGAAPGGPALEAGVWAALGLGLALALLALAQAGIGRWIGRTAGALPGPWGRLAVLRHLAQGSSQVLAPHPLGEALALSVGARLCDAAALYWVAQAFGLPLSAAGALAVLGSAGLVGGLSLLPGGVGAVEATMAALLVALGHDLPRALGVVLVLRVLIFWQWVALGLGLAIWRGLANVRLAAAAASPSGGRTEGA